MNINNRLIYLLLLDINDNTIFSLCLIYTKTITIPLSSSSNLNYLDYIVSSSAFF